MRAKAGYRLTMCEASKGGEVARSGRCDCGLHYTKTCLLRVIRHRPWLVRGVCRLGRPGVASLSTDPVGAGLGRRKMWEKGGSGEEIG